MYSRKLLKNICFLFFVYFVFIFLSKSPKQKSHEIYIQIQKNDFEN